MSYDTLAYYYILILGLKTQPYTYTTYTHIFFTYTVYHTPTRCRLAFGVKYFNFLILLLYNCNLCGEAYLNRIHLLLYLDFYSLRTHLLFLLYRARVHWTHKNVVKPVFTNYNKRKC